MKDLKDKITQGVWEKIKIETADYKDIVIGSDIKNEWESARKSIGL